jgi:hypothetical protein
MRRLFSRFVSLCIDVIVVSTTIDLKYFQEFDKHLEIVFVLISYNPLDIHATSIKIAEQKYQLMQQFEQ